MTHYSNDYFDLAADRANTSATLVRQQPGAACRLLPARAALAGAPFRAIALAAILVPACSSSPP
jgi:hypothetical protein